MKTTIEIAAPLFREACKLAAREGITLRALLERGLHRMIAESNNGAPFKLRRPSFKGRGLQPGFRDAAWEHLRQAVYQHRGG